MESAQSHSAYGLNPIENNRIWRNDCLLEWDNRQGCQRMGKKTFAEQRKMKERKIPEKWCIVVFRFRLYSSVRVCHFIEILLFMILRLAEQLRRLQLQVKIILCLCLECGKKKQIENQWRKRLTNMIMKCVSGSSSSEESLSSNSFEEWKHIVFVFVVLRSAHLDAHSSRLPCNNFYAMWNHFACSFSALPKKTKDFQ